MIARELMTADPVTVESTASIAEAWDLMRELYIRHIPVVQGGALVGMLSDRDLGQLDIGRVLGLEGAAAARAELARSVIESMSADVIFVHPETEVADVIGLLIEGRVGALPVIRPNTREVVGIISYVDVLRALQDRLDGGRGRT
jgi:acetoin utilization protein AcuB